MMNWDYLWACLEEATFCAKHYDSLAYWRDRTIDPQWYACYRMGDEL
jgi:hypothetical protein